MAPKLRLVLGAVLVSIGWLAPTLRHHSHATASIPLHIEQAWSKFSDTGEVEVNGPFNTSKLALMVEPRPLPRLVPLILHTLAVVPPDWRFLFIGSEQSVCSVGRSKAIQHHQASGRLELMEVPRPWRLEECEDVSALLTDVRFYDEVIPDVEWVFRFEQDGILCANSPVSLDEWLSWSWAGPLRSNIGGGGGFSLRRTSVVRQILSFQQRGRNSEPESVWFGKRIAALPGERVASDFHGLMSPGRASPYKPMGYHVPEGGIHMDGDIWEKASLWKEVLEYCPELTMILDAGFNSEMCQERKVSGKKSKTRQHGGHGHNNIDGGKKGLIHPLQAAPFPLVHS